MPEDNTKKAAELRAKIAELRAKAAQANEETKQSLENLDKYIKDYKAGLPVCLEICTIMNQYPDFQDIYPDIFRLCNCSKNQVKDS